MIEELNNYDWEEAFGFADGFTREDVAHIEGRAAAPFSAWAAAAPWTWPR